MTSTTQNKPLISVVIPTKDRPADLAQALDSVGEQSYPAIEVVIVDDGSDLGVNEAVVHFRQKYPDRLIVSRRNPSPKGGGYCRRLGSGVAQGEFVCFLDDDDFYLPSKLSVLWEYLERNPDVDAVFGRVVVRRRDLPDTLLDYGTYRHPLQSVKDISRLQTNGSLVRRAVLNEMGFHPELKKFQDTQFHLELCRKKTVHLLEEPVAVWHKNYSPKQVSHTSSGNGKQVIAHFDDLFKYLSSTNVLTADDLAFLSNQRMKYTARFGSWSEGLDYSGKVSPLGLIKFVMYRAYYMLRPKG